MLLGRLLDESKGRAGDEGAGTMRCLDGELIGGRSWMEGHREFLQQWSIEEVTLLADMSIPVFAAYGRRNGIIRGLGWQWTHDTIRTDCSKHQQLI